MAKKHMKRCSAWLIIREIQIKAITRYHLTWVRIFIIRKSVNKKCLTGSGPSTLNYKFLSFFPSFQCLYSIILFLFSQFSSVTQLCPTLCDLMDCNTTDFPIYHQVLELTQTHVHRVGDAIQPSHPLSSLSPAFNLSQHQRLFQGASSSYQVAKVLQFQLQHHPSNEYSGLIFRIDCLDLLAVQGTLKSLLQHHRSKASVLWHSTFFRVQLSHPYVTTGKP